ncbi:MAG: phasin family protein [Herbaspirillum sp.]
MVKKLKTLAKVDDHQLAEAVRTSAQQIWQAGLGAFAKAQEEGGRVFAKLVKDGTELQQRTQKLAGEKVSGVTDTVTKMADSVSKQASGSWDKLEQVFEDRVARSLASLGVPSHKEIQALTRRVQELSKAVDALSGKKPAAAKAPAKVAAKPVAKTTTKTTAKPSAKKVVKPVAKTAKAA